MGEADRLRACPALDGFDPDHFRVEMVVTQDRFLEIMTLKTDDPVFFDDQRRTQGTIGLVMDPGDFRQLEEIQSFMEDRAAGGAVIGGASRLGTDTHARSAERFEELVVDPHIDELGLLHVLHPHLVDGEIVVQLGAVVGRDFQERDVLDLRFLGGDIAIELFQLVFGVVREEPEGPGMDADEGDFVQPVELAMDRT